MTSPPVPPHAITAAAEALHQPCICGSDASHDEQMAWATQTAATALEAAAPYLAAAEGWEGPGVDAETMIEAANERRRAAKARIAEAVAAERERCAQLAEQQFATYPVPWHDGERHALGETKRKPFAVVLREAQP